MYRGKHSRKMSAESKANLAAAIINLIVAILSAIGAFRN